jgi:hypothetical protein
LRKGSFTNMEVSHSTHTEQNQDVLLSGVLIKMASEPIPASLTQALAQLGVLVPPEPINRTHVAWKPAFKGDVPPW